jgi:hypothetical protein
MINLGQSTCMTREQAAYYEECCREPRRDGGASEKDEERPRLDLDILPRERNAGEQDLDHECNSCHSQAIGSLSTEYQERGNGAAYVMGFEMPDAEKCSWDQPRGSTHPVTWLFLGE